MAALAAIEKAKGSGAPTETGVQRPHHAEP